MSIARVSDSAAAPAVEATDAITARTSNRKNCGIREAPCTYSNALAFLIFTLWTSGRRFHQRLDFANDCTGDNRLSGRAGVDVVAVGGMAGVHGGLEFGGELDDRNSERLGRAFNQRVPGLFRLIVFGRAEVLEYRHADISVFGGRQN